MISLTNFKRNFILFFLRKLFLKTMNVISAYGLRQLLNFQTLKFGLSLCTQAGYTSWELRAQIGCREIMTMMVLARFS